MASSWRSAKGENTECTVKRQRNKGAFNWKMTRDIAESVTCMSIDQSLSSC